MNLKVCFPVAGRHWKDIFCIPRILHIQNQHADLSGSPKEHPIDPIIKFPPSRVNKPSETSQYKGARSFSVPSAILKEYRKILAGVPAMSSRLIAKTQPHFTLLHTPDPTASKLVSNLQQAQHLHEMTAILMETDLRDIEITSLVTAVCQRDTAKRDPLLRALSAVCQRTIHTFDNATMLRVADSFLEFQFWSEGYLGAMMTQFELRISDGNLSREDILHILFYTIQFRNIPVPLLRQIEMQLPKNEFSFQMISLISYAFFNTNNPILSYDILRKFSEICLDGNSKGIQSSPQLSTILKLFRLSDFHDECFFDSLSAALQPKISSLNPRLKSSWNFLCNLSLSLADQRQKYDNIFKQMMAYIEQNAAVLRSDPHVANEKQITRIVYAFQQLRHETPQILADILVERLEAMEDEEVMKYSETFTEAIVALAMRGVFSEKLLRKAINRRLLKYKLSQTYIQDFQMVLLLEIVRKNLLKPPRTIMTKSQMQCLLARRDPLTIQLSWRQGTEELWASLLALNPGTVRYDHVGRHTWTADLELHIQNGQLLPMEQDPSVLPPSECDLHQVNSMTDVFRDQRSMDQSPDEMSVTEQLLLASGQRKQTSLADLQHLLPGQKYRQGGVRRVVVRVLCRNQLLQGTCEAHGLLHLDTQLLLRNGYEVVLVSPYLAEDLPGMDTEQRRDVARSILTMLQVLNA